ncbi:MAG: TM2 domain-containing protein [Bacteroidia bacterium]
MAKSFLFIIMLVSLKVEALVLPQPDSIPNFSSDTFYVCATDSLSQIALAEIQAAFDADSTIQQGENRRLIGTLLAIPFPFGIIGMHRIYLGCPPWIPIVYLVSFGGCFGILPLIDCIMIATADDKALEERYRNSSKLFMWVN